MATIDSEEPMECLPSTASAEDQKAVKVALSIWWLSPLEKNKKFILQTVLQSWVSTHKSTSTDELTCNVESVSKDSTNVVVSIKPPPDLSVLETLRGQTLSRNGKEMLMVKSACWDGSDVVMNAPPPLLPSETCQGRGEEVEGASALPLAAPSTAEDGYLEIPFNKFQAMYSTYHKELASIEERNNCQLEVKVKVMFVKVKGEGDTQTALSDVQTLLQRYEGQPHGFVISPSHDSEEVMTRISKPGKDFQVPHSSLEQHGPSQSKNATEPFGGVKGLVDDPKSSSWTPLQTPGDVKLDIDDPFGNGITLKKISWDLMKGSYTEQFIKVKSKFGVDFQPEFSQGNVRVRVVGGRNKVMQSNALRALCHLYKKIVTAPFDTNQPSGALGFSALPKHHSDPLKHIKRDYDNPLLNGFGDSTVKGVPAAQAATGGDGKEENKCSICYDDFTDKQQLVCKHEFCQGCLMKSIETMGPRCPICYFFFGTMVGNQPEGTMTSSVIQTPLPGYRNCDTIVIIYNIPNGIQTEKHPNPGANYHGTCRKAFLPNNEEGKQVLQLLRKAFQQKLIFTIGESRTTGMKNQVIWNDIHHKTSNTESSSYGYPDKNYLKRVRDELKAKGIE